jgi:hypothetical protein
MGRHKHVIDEFVCEHWHECNNLDVNAIGTADTTQFYFHCTCHTHKTLRTMQAVVKNPNTLECGICSPENKLKPPSSFECAAYNALYKLGHTDFMVEIKLLKARYGAADIVLQLHTGMTVIIMVDGQHHFRTTRCDRTHHEQSETDEAFNSAALAMNASVIRLHYKDCWSFEYQLRVFLQRCACSTQALLLKSPSFYAPTSV